MNVPMEATSSPGRQPSTLDRLRTASGRALLAFLWANVALVTGIATLRGLAGATSLIVAAALLAALPTAFAWRAPTGPTTRFLSSVALAGLVALVVAALRRGDVAGAHSLQVDAHMYFFACLAATAAWLDWRALVAYAGVVAVHHLGLSMLLPSLVFPDGGDLDRVILHAAILVVQTGILVWLVSRLQAGLAASDALLLSENDRNAAHASRTAAETEAQRESERAASVRRSVEAFDAGVRDVVARVETALAALEASADGLGGFAVRTRQDASEACDGSVRASDAITAADRACRGLARDADEIDMRLSAQDDVTRAAAADARRTGETAAALTATVGRIGSVAAAIRKIAEQTNLLALNATIEAARAGSAGRGFAVVAEEVKALAGQTARATEEIAGQIADVEGVAARSAATMDAFAARVREIQDGSGAIVAAVVRQRTGLTEMERSVAGTVAAAEAATRHVRAVSGVLGTTTEVAASVHGSADAVRDQVATLRRVTEGFMSEITRLTA